METRVPHRPTVTDPATLGGTLLCSCVLRATWLPVRNGPACRYLRITSRSCPCTLMPLWSHPRSHPCPRVYAMRMPLLAITIEWSCDRDDHHAPCTTTPRPPPSHTFLTLFFSGMVCQGSPPASALGPATRATRAHRAPPPPPPTSAAQGSTASQGPQHAFSAPQVPAFGWFTPPPPIHPLRCWVVRFVPRLGRGELLTVKLPCCVCCVQAPTGPRSPCSWRRARASARQAVTGMWAARRRCCAWACALLGKR